MDCREAEQMVMPYINHALTDEELSGFLEHIESCESCREELEIYFTVEVGIRQLDTDTGTYDIRGALKSALEASRQQIGRSRARQIARYAADTLGTIGFLTALFLQCRLWWQNGIF